MIGHLPTELTVNGRSYAIRTHFRAVLDILCAFDDPELEDDERVYICLYILYEDFDSIPESDYKAAFTAALEFIEHGTAPDKKSHTIRLMDWEQDERLLFPAVNKVAGFETRSADYLHWWTFLGYYMEISDGVFSQILGMRAKKAKGKPLEKWEKEYWGENKDICELKTKLTAEEQAAKDRLNALLG